MYVSTPPRRPLQRVLIAPLAILALAFAGCSSDDEGSDDTPSSATDSPATDAPDTTETASPETAAPATDPAEPATTDVASTDTPPEATGEPATVWVIEDSSEAAGVTFPSIRAGIEARVQRINAEGGLGGSGRPIVVEFCVTNFDPNAAAQCARDAVADETAIAVAGSVSASGDTTLPILEEGGLAMIGSTAFAAADGTSTVSFPTMGGLVAATGCQASILRDEAGATSIGVARGDTPGADQVGGLLTALGFPPVAEVVTPVANPDYSAEIGAVGAQADALILAQDGATALKTVRAIGQLGLSLSVSGSGGQAWTPEALEQAGDAAEGMYLSLWYAADDSGAAGIEAYLADLAAVDGANLSDDLAKMGWIAFDLLDSVSAGLDTIDRDSVLTGLSATSAYDSGGVAPVLDFTTPGTLLFGTMPRFVNQSCVYAQVEGGKVVGLSDFLTPFAG